MRDPENAAVLSEAVYRLQISQPERALTLAASVLERAPTDSNAAHLVAVALLELERPEEAASIAADLLSAVPDDPVLRGLWAEIQQALGDFVEAERTYLDLLRQSPGDVSLICNYAGLMWETLRLEKAERLYAEALRHDPEHEDASLGHLFCRLSSGSVAVDDPELRKRVDQQPDAAASVVAVAVALVEAKRFAEAMPLLQLLLRGDPSNSALVGAIVECRLALHPLMWPYRPMVRWGWLASGVIYVVMMGFAVAARPLSERLPAWGAWVLTGVLGAYAVWVLGSWAVPPALRRLIRKRGV